MKHKDGHYIWVEDYLIPEFDENGQLIACDLDNLKHINDSLGHLKGDSLIKSTAKVMQLIFDDDEYVVSRTGGDEFVVIIKNKSLPEIEDLYLKMRRTIKVFNENNKDLPIQISIGLAYSETSISKMHSAIDIADKDMYKSKKNRKQINII
ncbi:GGDEF domain-containing protein [Clostridium sp. YIM B02515]|uniref:GGDEF domain-containing protein n=2 Tax=Clostridium rhizosphaerae TaxID=2803861 RepID=A0ABS1T514_9CLOT|nr:GGDEF domain-containing protein [Clostridium rhizosphaerae]